MVHKSPIRFALQFLNMVFFAINFLFVKKKSIFLFIKNLLLFYIFIYSSLSKED